MSAVRELRDVFNAAYRVWRETELSSPYRDDCECNNTIPYDGTDLLDLLAVDLERALARKVSA